LLVLRAQAAKQIGLRQERPETHALTLSEWWEWTTRRTAVMGDELQRGLESRDTIAGGDSGVDRHEARLEHPRLVEPPRLV
jgi:hypothetical protein